jgi:hypothetical protein
MYRKDSQTKLERVFQPREKAKKGGSNFFQLIGRVNRPSSAWKAADPST